MSTDQSTLNVESAVRERYGAAALAAEAALCCPVSYDAKFLEIIPDEIIERDYGCGDPSKHLQPGDNVLDLGSGGGKICYIASQVVGAEGSVTGVDMNDDMLALAREHQDTVANAIGFRNTSFRKGRIQDLKLDIDQFEEHLRKNPVSEAAGWLAAEAAADQLRETQPMIEDGSIDAVVSNCVLNLVRNQDRKQLFAELHRVLKIGGRAIISDIVSDEEVPESLQNDAHLWSGCISGAFQESAFLQAFEEAGFGALEIVSRQEEPWAVVEGIEFRSLTVRAWKQDSGACLERHQAAIYNGPWKTVVDDDGQQFHRGERMAVCDRTYQAFGREPYASHITRVAPKTDVAAEGAGLFDCSQTQLRSPVQTKQGASSLTILPSSDCCSSDDSSCC